MRKSMKKLLAACMAVILACTAVSCGKSSDSSSDSGTSSAAVTTTTAPVVEDMGNIDLSEVTNDYDVPEDFKFESEAEKGTLSGAAAVLDKNFLGEYSGDGFVSIGAEGDMVEFDVELPIISL